MGYIADAVGLFGVFLCLLAYGLARKGQISAYKAPFIILNTVASAMVIFSLSYTFNLAAFILEIAWLIISISSLMKIVIKRDN